MLSRLTISSERSVTVHIQTVDSERGLNGFISRFSQGSRDERFTYYRAEMVPWLWFLTRTADCRIFQRKTAPDIIKKIFSDLGFSDFELRLLWCLSHPRVLRAVPGNRL